MRLVALVAEHAAGVFRGDDLGEAFGLGGVLLMTASAEVGHIGKGGFLRGGIVGFGVGGLGAVAGFAGDMRVAAGGANFGLLVVTEDAGILSGVRDGTRANHVEGGGPVVAILAESFRHDGGPDDEKESQRGEEDEGRTDEVSGVTHDTFQAETPFLGNDVSIRERFQAISIPKDPKFSNY